MNECHRRLYGDIVGVVRLRFLLAGLLVCGCLCNCSRKDAGTEISETRVVPPSPSGESAANVPSKMPENSTPAPKFVWTVPAGWTAAPSTAMRAANFKIGPAPEAECYMSVLRGTAGGLEANINRWRSQMGVQTPLSDGEIANLARIPVAGQAGVLLEVSGEYTGMTGKNEPGYMLLGTMAILGDQSVFVKMIGPETTVKAQRESFIAFCGSLKKESP